MMMIHKGKGIRCPEKLVGAGPQWGALIGEKKLLSFAEAHVLGSLASAYDAGACSVS